jgi:SAM-dependent methyltransferase
MTTFEEAMLTVGAPEPTISAWKLLDDPDAPRTAWSISKTLALELAEHLERTTPKRILEIGSGFSTAILAAYAARHHGVQVVSLEHSKRYEERTRRGLRKLKLEHLVDLKLANLREHMFINGERYLWYDLRAAGVDGRFDFVFVDGPPKRQGRWGALFGLADYLATHWEMWVDDGRRQHEQKCIKLWKQHIQFSYRLENIDGKGLWILRDSSRPDQGRPEPEPWPGGLGIGILADGDPTWRERARTLIDQRLLDDCFVAAATEDAALRQDDAWVDKHVIRDGQSHERLAIRVLQTVALQRGVEYVLYLDDDWGSRTLDKTWLSRALRYLREHAEVDQVYLSHRMAGERRVNPEIDGMGFVERAGPPIGGEPSLIRAQALVNGGLRLRRIRRARPRAVQLSPGVFFPNRPPGRRHSVRPVTRPGDAPRARWRSRSRTGTR